MPRRLAMLFVLSALAGCASVTVTPAGGASSYPPRSANCEIEFWPVRPDRPFEVLGELRATFAVQDLSVGVREIARQKACALGADAVIGLHEIVGAAQSGWAGTVVRYRAQ